MCFPVSLNADFDETGYFLGVTSVEHFSSTPSSSLSPSGVMEVAYIEFEERRPTTSAEEGSLRAHHWSTNFS